MHICLILLAFFLLAGPAMPMSRISSNKDDEKEVVGILEDILMPDDLDEEQATDWKNGVPPGWSKGRKAGWEGESIPPGAGKETRQKRKTQQRKAPRKRGYDEEKRKHHVDVTP